ncbi:MAG: PEP-CTERM sorting domain-containing protein [Phycisphaeraceae bacterium]
MRTETPLKLFSTAAMLLALGLTGTDASALPFSAVELSDGITTLVINDGDVDDMDARPGVIMVDESIGAFDLSFTVGLSNPFVGSLDLPIMQLTSVNATSTSAGDLSVKLTSTGLTGPVPTGFALLEVGGTTNGSIDFAAYVDDTDAPFGEGVLAASTPSFSGGSFSDTDSSLLPLTDPYSATIIANISHTGAGVTGFDAQLTIPEPGSAVLFGLGVAGLAARRRRRA